jgi:hypothetical protein
MHFGSDGGGERGAAIYSLVAIAKLYTPDLQAYLRHVIARIADASRQSRGRTVAMNRCSATSLQHRLNSTRRVQMFDINTLSRTVMVGRLRH